MAALNFPDPAVQPTYEVDDVKWEWDGRKWGSSCVCSGNPDPVVARPEITVPKNGSGYATQATSGIITDIDVEDAASMYYVRTSDQNYAVVPEAWVNDGTAGTFGAGPTTTPRNTATWQVYTGNWRMINNSVTQSQNVIIWTSEDGTSWTRRYEGEADALNGEGIVIPTMYAAFQHEVAGASTAINTEEWRASDPTEELTLVLSDDSGLVGDDLFEYGDPIAQDSGYSLETSKIVRVSPTGDDSYVLTFADTTETHNLRPGDLVENNQKDYQQWTMINSPQPGAYFWDIDSGMIDGKKGFIACGGNGDCRIGWSLDGISWNLIDVGDYNLKWITSNGQYGSKWMAIEESGAGIKSEDGLNWTPITQMPSAVYYGLAANPAGVFVGCNILDPGNTVSTTFDFGVSWTAYDTGSARGSGIACNPIQNSGQFVVGGYGTSNVIGVSGSGGNYWGNISSYNGDTGLPFAVAASKKTTTTILLHGNSTGMHISNNSITTFNNFSPYTGQVNGTVLNINGAYYGGTTDDDGYWVVLNKNQTAANDGIKYQVLYSENDGLTWEATPAPVPLTWQRVAYANGIFCAVAISGGDQNIMVTAKPEIQSLNKQMNGDVEQIVVKGGLWYADPANGGDGSGNSSGNTSVKCTYSPGKGTVGTIDTAAKTMVVGTTPFDNYFPYRWIGGEGKYVKGALTASSDAPIPVNITLQSTTFEAAPPVAHIQTSWQICKNSEPSYDSAPSLQQDLNDPANLLSWKPPNDLEGDTLYKCRVRYTPALGNTSGWSKDCVFRTE